MTVLVGLEIGAQRTGKRTAGQQRATVQRIALKHQIDHLTTVAVAHMGRRGQQEVAGQHQARRDLS